MERRFFAIAPSAEEYPELQGGGFIRLWPVNDARQFDALLAAIDEAEGTLDETIPSRVSKP